MTKTAFRSYTYTSIRFFSADPSRDTFLPEMRISRERAGRVTVGPPAALPGAPIALARPAGDTRPSLGQIIRSNLDAKMAASPSREGVGASPHGVASHASDFRRQ